ncbi:MAG: hypothetical protein IPK82_23880 [Polyangiaceae bacterium]|nr:hypothetical protein [Polyangiaceae bacterium]
MLTLTTALLHLAASALGGMSSAIAVEWWRTRKNAPMKAAAPQTAGAAIDGVSQRSTRVDRRVHTAGVQAPGVRIGSVHTNAATNARVRTTGSIQLAGAALAKGAGVSVVTGGKVDTFAALKKIVAAVPFYGPPAAAALDVARESGVQLVRGKQERTAW